jgi:hypothetical protein
MPEPENATSILQPMLRHVKRMIDDRRSGVCEDTSSTSGMLLKSGLRLTRAASPCPIPSRLPCPIIAGRFSVSEAHVAANNYVYHDPLVGVASKKKLNNVGSMVDAQISLLIGKLLLGRLFRSALYRSILLFGA